MKKFFGLIFLVVFAASARAQVGDVTGVHDPCLIKAGDTYVLLSTGDLLPVRESKDLFNWKRVGQAMKQTPPWAAAVAKTKHFWAPDIAFFNGRFHLYYSVSSFGSQRSAIGVMTSPTLDRADKSYRWTERGSVIESKPGDDFNAIDSAVCVDEAGTPWMAVGSFWGGIKLVELDPKTGKRANADKPRTIAARPDDAAHAIEAAFLFRHDQHYYLFVSYDLCCRGEKSTYNLRVGRSKSITGPYADRDGKPMTRGGGTPLLESNGDVFGPGHCSVLHDAAGDFLVHHFYDGTNAGRPTLQIRPLTWDAAGWPAAGEPISAPLKK